jgi:hypothetical protein
MQKPTSQCIDLVLKKWTFARGLFIPKLKGELHQRTRQEVEAWSITGC